MLTTLTHPGSTASSLSEPVVRERRGRSRFDLRLAVRLSRAGTWRPITAWTESVSCDGFFCVCPQRFALGEILKCEVVVEAGNLSSGVEPLVLCCDVKVTRIRSGAEPGFAGQLLDYSVNEQFFSLAS